MKTGLSWLNRGTWYVDPDKCPGLASELSTYKWREDKEGNPMDEPVNFKDDALAACRYAAERLSAPRQTVLIGDYAV